MVEGADRVDGISTGTMKEISQNVVPDRPTKTCPNCDNELNFLIHKDTSYARTYYFYCPFCEKFYRDGEIKLD